ncbi:VOC family protein [Clostridium estertheticum]|uniref:VOC family protein n=1 Tax=Clostridium estertheticum TaxID=238834 RepID=A0A5N7J7A4_9CLOT|nr:VOC family protein [Clostridium estertheticum]MPQ33956.1 VOC family protein [Clostridium estertheticum]MPQ64585.1 VOC family protein [Clostridium estertheticum]
MKSYDNFFLGVNDLTEAREYYETILGLQLKFDFSKKGMIAFKVGDEEPAIILKNKNIFSDIKPTIWFEVEDVEAEYRRLRDNGVNFLCEPFKIMTGMAVEFEDPFGNRLGITDYTDKK